MFILSDQCLDEVQEVLAKVLMPGRRLGLMMSDSGLEEEGEEQVRVIVIAFTLKNASSFMPYYP